MADPDEGGPEYCSMDVDVYGEAVTDLEKTHSGISDHILGLESDFGYFGVSMSNFNKLREAKTGLDDVLPDLRRRHSLAVQLLEQQQEQGWGGDGKISFTGDILNDDFASVEDAQNAGDNLAEQVNESFPDVPEDLYEQLEQYGHDPDFAEAFVKGLSPEAAGFLLIEADNAAQGTGGDDPDDGPQLALANVFSTASFRIDYDEEYIAPINQAMLDHDLHPDGVRIAERLTALAQEGTWDHESVLALAETATSGDYDTIGVFRDEVSLLGALSNTPRAAAEYMAADPERAWQISRNIPTGVSTDEWDAAFAEFLTVATVDAESIYYRIGLYDEGQVNVAEQNAAAWITKYHEEQEAGNPTSFGDQTRGAFADMIENYWDDLVYSNTSPGGVSDNPHRDGIELPAEVWQSFVTETMRSPDPAARVVALVETWYNEEMEATAGAENPAEHEYDRKAIRGLVASFNASWQQVVQEYEDDEAAREAFGTKLAELGVGMIFDPTGAPKELAKTVINGIFGAIISGSIDSPDMPAIDFEFASTNNEWTNAATDEYNARRNGDGIPPYNDGDVTWEGDPAFYGELYGASFTDESGNVLHPSDPEFPDDPRALEAFNEWCKDPAVQILLHDWNMSSSTEGGN